MDQPRVPVLGLLVLLAAPFAARPAAAQEPLRLEVSGGVHQVLREEEVAAEGGFELIGRPYPLPWRSRLRPDVVPLLGAMGTGDGAFYAYVGFGLDFHLGRRLTVQPNWAAGVYDQGREGRDLGGPVEFRSALDVSFEIGERSAAGLSFYHLSNAGIYDRNPGSESLVLTYAFAPRW